jgi:2,4-dienoyl-CoA reductase-like NADH-dependent reductase (Old Yellow Enzyme family)/thioredoxin reductase
MMSSYKNVFSPIKIGPKTIRNRIFSAAHHTGFAEKGLWNERHFAYYETKARGGIGMLISGGMLVTRWDPDNPFAPEHDQVFAPGQVDRFREGLERVHKHGAVMLAQLGLLGRQDWYCGESMMPALAPSAIPCPETGVVPKEMEEEDIDQCIRDFADAAEICKEGGFDGIEIHCAYGYLLSGFLTPTNNTREDDYGGSLENRMRFPLAVVKAVRERVGADLIVGVRMLADEYIDGGIDVESAKEIAKAFEATGLVDYLNVSPGTYERMALTFHPMAFPMGWAVYLSQNIKEVVDIPVIHSSRIKEPPMAERILANHYVDMVGMTRATITDPDLPRKMLEGREDEIRSCIGCNQKCLANTIFMIPISCMQNPVAGREFSDFWRELKRAENPGPIVVVGAGPAGCEAAIALAERGHQVALYDRGSEVGGQLLTVEKASGREEWQDVYRFHKREIDRLGVELHLETELTAEDILALEPGRVVIATGSTPRVQPFDYLPRVEGIENALNVRDVLDGKATTGETVAIYAGDNNLQALTLADTLLDQGKTVHIICPSDMPGKNAEPLTLGVVIQRLVKKGLAGMILEGVITRFDGAKVSGVASVVEYEFEVPCDTFISSFGGDADGGLYFELKGKVDVHRVGDAVAPRTADSAIFDGAKIGREL